MKVLGVNIVEIYIFWNIYELEEGVYDFEGMKNIEVFVCLVEKLNLLVILCFLVYICVEWEFGGLLVWFLKKKGVWLCLIDFIFMIKVCNYF